MKRVRSTTKKTRKMKVPVAWPLDGKRAGASQAGSSKPPARPGAGTWVDPLTPAERMERNRRAAALLREWMADDSGYDEEMWPVLEQALKEDPVRFREDF